MDDYFAMVAGLQPSEKQLRLIAQLSEHFDEVIEPPTTRFEAQDILTELIRRRQEERNASA